MSQSSTQKSSITAGRIAVGLLVVLIIVFAVLNSQSVRMHWIVTTTDTPLFVILVLFAFIGLVIGYIVGRRPRGRE